MFRLFIVVLAFKLIGERFPAESDHRYSQQATMIINFNRYLLQWFLLFHRQDFAQYAH